MLIQKNETAIQVLKILYSQNKKKSKKIKKTHYNTVYPRAIEAKYKTKLSSYFQPLIDYVNKFLEENEDALLRGDSMQLKLDVLPGGTFRRMIASLEGWLSVYMPTVPELKEGQNNVILMGLNQTAEQLKAHEDKQFQKQLQNGIGVSFQTDASWWSDTKTTWAGNNYNLIVSNARNYVNQINNLAEQAVVNGWSPKQLQEQIKKASNGLSDKKCRLLARDQIGKLQGQVAEAQMEEIGLEMYIWDTSGDERVRGNPAGKYPTGFPSHYVMDGLLCRWDDATVYSKDNGKTWINRPANAVKLHPGRDIQCRCVALAYIPELLHEMDNNADVKFEEVNNIETPVQLTSEEMQLKQQLAEQLSTEFKSLKNNEMDSVLNSLVTKDFGYIDKNLLTNKSVINKLHKYIDSQIGNTISVYNASGLKCQLEILQDLAKNNKPLTHFRTKNSLDKMIEFISKINNGDLSFIKNNFSYEDFIYLSSTHLGNPDITRKSNSLGLLKYTNFEKLDNTTFFHNYIRGAFDTDNYITSLEKINVAKDVNMQFSKINFDLKSYSPYSLFRNIELAKSHFGTPWGTADEWNKDAFAIAFWDTEYKPFNKKTQKLVNGFTHSIDEKTLRQSIGNRLKAQEIMKNSKCLVPSKVSYGSQDFNYFKNNEFLRMQFSFDGNEVKYKVGQVLEQTGICAFSPSELHNEIWYDSKTKQGAKYPVRFHLKDSEKVRNSASLVIVDDLGTGTGTKLNPEEIDFAISKLKVVKIEDGFVVDKTRPVKEVWVEIAD